MYKQKCMINYEGIQSKLALIISAFSLSLSSVNPSQCQPAGASGCWTTQAAGDTDFNKRDYGCEDCRDGEHTHLTYMCTHLFRICTVLFNNTSTPYSMNCVFELYIELCQEKKKYPLMNCCANFKLLNNSSLHQLYVLFANPTTFESSVLAQLLVLPQLS